MAYGISVSSHVCTVFCGGAGCGCRGTGGVRDCVHICILGRGELYLKYVDLCQYIIIPELFFADS